MERAKEDIMGECYMSLLADQQHKFEKGIQRCFLDYSAT